MSSERPLSLGRTSRPYALAQNIVISAFKIVLPDVATRIEGIAAIADLIVAPDKAPTVTRLIDDNTRHLAKRLEKLESIEYVGLDEAEKGLAVNGVHSAISKANITRSDIIKDRLGGNEILQTVQPLAEVEWQSQLLSESATSYGQRYLQEACAFLASIVRQLPDFSDQLLVANYDLTYKIHELLQDGINKVVLPRYRKGESLELSAFESEYLSSVISTNDTMEVFGLNVPEELRQQRIDIAYITLKVSTLGDPASQPSQFEQTLAGMTENPSEHSTTCPTLRVDEAIGEVAQGNIVNPEDGQRRTETVKGSRILLSGSAGSGKTTIARWLAIRAAQHRFPDALESWNACTPFIVPLRKVFPGDTREEPGLDDLIHPIRLHNSLPGGWLVKHLTQDSLVILDGLDEISRNQRPVFARWVRKLYSDFPNLNILITSRPEGIDSEWFSDMNFTQLALQPMSLPDIRRCIKAWFKALLLISVRDRDQHVREQGRLISDIERQNTLQDLASTPLLCAMLCAFYTYKHTTAPETRGELYDEVIKTLIHERDYERDSERTDLVTLPRKQRSLLLQGLARYMTDESMITLVTERHLQESQNTQWPTSNFMTAIEFVEQRIRRMSLLAASPTEALRILLDRSIVFRRVGYYEAHFAHRSIQEYLTACDYVDDGDVEKLIARAEDPKWWSIIAFAAGRLAMTDTSLLVSGILQAAIKALGDQRRSLIMLAAECYVVAGGLEEEIASRVKTMIREVFPPTNEEEADMVARCGSQVLPLLAKKGHLTDEVAAACVRSAATIGGPEALAIIADYAKEANNKPLLINEVVNGWQRFDVRRYAEVVLKAVDPGDAWISLRTHTIVSAAGSLPSMKKARIEAFEGFHDFRSWSDLGNLEELDFAGNWRLNSLKGIPNLPRLRKVNLSGARELQSIEDLSLMTSIEELSLTGCSGLRSIEALTRLTKLKVLLLDGCNSVTDFTPLSHLNELRVLSVNGCRVSDLSWCSSLPRLQQLQAIVRSGIRNASGLSSCNDLYWLQIKMDAHPDSVLDLPSGGNLRSLLIKGAVDPVDLSHIQRHTCLESLYIERADGLEDLGMLSGLSGLRFVAATDCQDLLDATAIGRSRGLEEIDLSGSAIENIDFLRDMHKLARVKVNRCARLRDISALGSLPSLEYVSALNVFRGVRPAPGELRDMINGGRPVVVVHDPLVVGNYEAPVNEFEEDNDYIDDRYEADPDFGLWYGDQG